MRKFVCMLLVGILSVSLCACGEAGAQKGLSKEEFLSYVEVVEVTTENWDNYFSCIEQDYEEIDAFGEETGNMYTNLCLCMQENCFVVDQIVIELSYKETSRNVTTDAATGEKQEGVSGERECRFAHVMKTRDYGLSAPICTVYLKTILTDSVSETYKEVKNITCTRVMGKVAKVSIPDEVWRTDADGDKYIVIDDKTFYSMDTSDEKHAGDASIAGAITQFVE